jgi:RNA polymerase sigma-70 factor (ECF subfamily)
MAVDDEAMTAAFVAALVPELRPLFGDTAALAATLAEQRAVAVAAYPAITVPSVEFAAELARRLGAAATPDQLARLRADHVHLAIACIAADEVAIRTLESDFIDEVDSSARRMRATPDQIDELKGHLRTILFVSEPGRAAALRDYSGRGDLRTYLRVIATRELVRVIDRGRREVAIDEESFLDRLAPVSDPGLGFLRESYRADVSAAMRAALANLDEPSRALLRYSVVDGWTVDRIAALYGVHRATAGRRVAAARDALGAAIRAELARRLAIPVADVDSIVRLVQSRIDVSLERLLE